MNLDKKKKIENEIRKILKQNDETLMNFLILYVFMYAKVILNNGIEVEDMQKMIEEMCPENKEEIAQIMYITCLSIKWYLQMIE